MNISVYISKFQQNCYVGSITTFRLFQNNALAEIRAKNHSMVSTRVLPAMAHGLIL